MMNISDAADAGDFVVRAYDAYHDAPSALFPAVALPPGCDFVAWVTMEDFLVEPGPNDRRFYGFIAHVTATDHYVFALRGTEGWREWWDDFHVVLVPFPGVTRDGKVAYGFRTIYETLDITYVNQDVYAFHAPHLGRMGAEQTFTEKLRSVLRVHEAERRSVAGAERALLTPDVVASVQRLGLADPWRLSALVAVLSNVVSNVPAVLALRPFIPPLADAHRAWLIVAMSSTLAGNLTLLGSVANLIVAEQARAAATPIGFFAYFKVGLPLTLVTLAFGTAWLVWT